MDKVFAIYSRKSRFTGKGESVENQVEMCRDYIRTHFSPTEADNALVFEDEGFSGKNLERPQFKEMMKAVKDKQISYIVCYRLDRISRNIGDFANLITELTGDEVSFISIKEQFDTNLPMGRAMMYIASIFSQLERETIAERIRDNLHELAKTGRWLGGNTPTGYKSESETSININGKTKKAFHLSVIDEEAELVKLIYSLFLEHNSLTAVESYLLAHNIKTKNDNDYTRFSIRAILTNPVYMIADKDSLKYLTGNNVDLYSTKDEFDGVHGIMAYNRTKQEQGKATKQKDMEEWIVSVGKHTGLISGRDWIKVQGMLNANKSKAYKKAKSHTALLSGLLKCGDCGDYMRPHMTKRINKDGELTYYYSCNLKLRSKGSRCNIKNVNGNEIDKIVINALINLHKNNNEYFKALKKSLTETKVKTDNFEKEIAKLKAEIENSEASIQSYLDTLVDSKGTPAEQYLLDKINKLGSDINEKKLKIDALEAEIKQDGSYGDSIELLKDILRHFAGAVDNMSVEQKRLAIRSFIKEVIWDGENAHIIFFGAENLYQSGEDRKRDTYAFQVNEKRCK